MESTSDLADRTFDGPSDPEDCPGTLSNPYEAHHYREQQLQPCAEYRGITDCWDDNEALGILRELLDRFPLAGFWGFALPPTGLPGTRLRGLAHRDPAARLLSLGLRYAEAVIRNKGRAMHRRWEDAEEFIRKIQSEEEGRLIALEVQRAIDLHDEQQAIPQLVYFIASQSGPIKIGIAVRPLERLKGLQTSHHEKLELLATCEGGQAQERAYHKLFADKRLNGEWFERCPEILAEIDEIKRRSDQPSPLPLDRKQAHSPVAE